MPLALVQLPRHAAAMHTFSESKNVHSPHVAINSMACRRERNRREKKREMLPGQRQQQRSQQRYNKIAASLEAATSSSRSRPPSSPSTIPPLTRGRIFRPRPIAKKNGPTNSSPVTAIGPTHRGGMRYGTRNGKKKKKKRNTTLVAPKQSDAKQINRTQLKPNQFQHHQTESNTKNNTNTRPTAKQSNA